MIVLQDSLVERSDLQLNTKMYVAQFMKAFEDCGAKLEHRESMHRD